MYRKFLVELQVENEKDQTDEMGNLSSNSRRKPDSAGSEKDERDRGNGENILSNRRTSKKKPKDEGQPDSKGSNNSSPQKKSPTKRRGAISAEVFTEDEVTNYVKKVL